MTTCPECDGSTEYGFHVCTSKSPCTAHYACDCLKEKITRLEATIKTYCEETSRLNIDRNKLEAQLKEKATEMEKSHEYVREHGIQYRGEIIYLKDRIEKLRKAIEPFAKRANRHTGIIGNRCAECADRSPCLWEIAKRAYEQTA